MSYGPGYTLWKQILREREERRLARLQAKRGLPLPQDAKPAARKRKLRGEATTPKADGGAAPAPARTARRSSPRRAGATEPTGVRAGRSPSA